MSWCLARDNLLKYYIPILTKDLLTGTVFRYLLKYENKFYITQLWRHQSEISQWYSWWRSKVWHIKILSPSIPSNTENMVAIWLWVINCKITPLVNILHTSFCVCCCFPTSWLVGEVSMTVTNWLMQLPWPDFISIAIASFTLFY